MVKLVVRAECQKGSNADAVREEDLGSTVDPAFRRLQPLPVRREEELDSVKGALQSQGLGAQDGQQDIGSDG